MDDWHASEAPTPYVPVDPFRPSIAFSLNNVLPQRQHRGSRASEFGRIHRPPGSAHARRARARPPYEYGHYPPPQRPLYRPAYASPHRSDGGMIYRIAPNPGRPGPMGFNDTGSGLVQSTSPRRRSRSRSRRRRMGGESETEGDVVSAEPTVIIAPYVPSEPSASSSHLADPPVEPARHSASAPTGASISPPHSVAVHRPSDPPPTTPVTITLPSTRASVPRPLIHQPTQLESPPPPFILKPIPATRGRSILISRDESLSSLSRSRTPPASEAEPVHASRTSAMPRSPSLPLEIEAVSVLESVYPHRSRSHSHSRSRGPRRISFSMASLQDFHHAPSPAILSLSDEKDSQDDLQESQLTQPFDTGTYSIKAYVAAFLLDTLPRQIYLYMLLRLPYLYFSRVTRIFEEAEMSMPMIKQGILDAAKAKTTAGYYTTEARVRSPVAMSQTRQMLDEKMFDAYGNPAAGTSSQPYLSWAYWEPPPESVAYTHLQDTWEGFIDSLQKEWKTLNIISVLLLSAILTILQIPAAAADPITRYTALLSMICALMSVLYGCIYIIRFGTMRKTYKGAEWAEEAQKTKTGIFWNVWVLLAMPATWLAWSMILFIATIMSFVWRTTPVSQPNAVDESSAQILVPRIIISLAVALGVVYFTLIAATLRRYGDLMDRAWQKRIWAWLRDGDGVGVGGGGGVGSVQAFTSNAFVDGAKEEIPEMKSAFSSRSISHESRQEKDAHPALSRQMEVSGSMPTPGPDRSDADLVHMDTIGQTNPRPYSATSPLHSELMRPSASWILSTGAGIENGRASFNDPSLGRAQAESVLPRAGNAVDMPIDADPSSPRQLDIFSRLPGLELGPLAQEAAQHMAPEDSSRFPERCREDDEGNEKSVRVAPTSGFPSVDVGQPATSGSNELPGPLSNDNVQAQRPLKVVKLFSLSSTDSPVDVMSEQDLADCGIDLQGLGLGELDKFRAKLCATVLPNLGSDIGALVSSAAPCLNDFNQTLRIRGMEGRVVLCQEQTRSFLAPPEYAIYYFAHFDPFSPAEVARMANQAIQRYGAIADGLQRLDVLALDNEADSSGTTKVVSLVPGLHGAQDLRIATSSL